MANRNNVLARWLVLRDIYGALVKIINAVEDIPTSESPCTPLYISVPSDGIDETLCALLADCAKLRPDIKAQTDEIATGLKQLFACHEQLRNQEFGDICIDHFVKELKCFLFTDLFSKSAEAKIFHPDARVDWFDLFSFPFEHLCETLVKHLFFTSPICDELEINDIFAILQAASASDLCDQTN